MGSSYVDPQFALDDSEIFLTSRLGLIAAPGVVDRIWHQQRTPWAESSSLSEIEEASSKSISPWRELALSIVHQSLRDAAKGDYDALHWLLTEGREWLQVLGISPWIVDAWGSAL